MILEFCPQAVEYGDLSSVFSAVGTVAAVVISLCIAIRDARKHANDKREAFQRDQLHHQFYIRILADLMSEIETNCQNAIDHLAGLQHTFRGSIPDDEFGRLEKRAERLMERADMPPIVYAAATEAEALLAEVNDIRHEIRYETSPSSFTPIQRKARKLREQLQAQLLNG
ncbi:MAG: hypothetical protein VYD90_05365 [Pseudomonadota bacterium]|nr:hypothetical protein [Pseudomonadota bacterium]